MRLKLNGDRLAWVALIEIAPQCSPASISASRIVTVAVMLLCYSENPFLIQLSVSLSSLSLSL